MKKRSDLAFYAEGAALRKDILYMKKTVKVLIAYAASMSLSAAVHAYSGPGSSGEEVRQIQLALRNRNYSCGAADGVYGEKTCRAVRQFQSDSGLAADGIAGRKTLLRLGVGESDTVMLLARVINGEARGESYEGQVAVGAVILNRVSHPSFPNSVRGVVYQKGAFSAVSDGQINKKLLPSCIAAAKEALSGSDPTGGALYYYNPDTATCRWIRTRPVIKRIGNHLFCS